MARRTAQALWLVPALWCMPAQAQPTTTADLSFGSFIAGSGGTVTVGSAGQRSRSGGVLLVAQGAPASPAQVNVLGPPNAMFSISLPPDGTVSLTDGHGRALPLNQFVSNPAGAGTLSSAGSARVHIGAALSVGPAQPPGAYAGSFAITINHN